MKTYILKSSLPIFPIDTHSVSGDYKIQVQAEAVSDGYHTMDELYEHRYRLFLALVKIYDNYITPLGCNIKCWKSRLHDDGSMYADHFLLGMSITRAASDFVGPDEKFDISYHLPNKYWHLANVTELDKAPPYDGYTSRDVLERLLRL